MQSMIGICWGVRRVGILSTDRTYPTLVPFPLSLRFARKFSSIFALASRIYALVFLVTILSLEIYSLSIFRSRKKHLPFFNPIGNNEQTSVGTSAVLTIFRPRRKHRANFSGNPHCVIHFRPRRIHGANLSGKHHCINHFWPPQDTRSKLQWRFTLH